MKSLRTIAVLALMLIALGACGLGSTTTVTTGGGGGAHSTLPTSTPLPATCATLLPGSSAASAGGSFADVAFPTGSLGTGLTLHHSGTGQWTIYLMQVCSPATTQTAVRSFFASQLPAHGWAYSATLPFSGDYHAPCGDPYCWGKGTAPRYVGLESVTAAANNNVTYIIRLFVPPPTPVCTDPYGIYATRTFQSSYTDNGVNVPMPALTLFGIGDGYANGVKSADAIVGMCSAGNAASINAFFTTELPALGWTYGPVPSLLTPCATGSAWYQGHSTFSWYSQSAVTNGLFWQLSSCKIL